MNEIVGRPDMETAMHEKTKVDGSSRTDARKRAEPGSEPTDAAPSMLRAARTGLGTSVLQRKLARRRARPGTHGETAGRITDEKAPSPIVYVGMTGDGPEEAATLAAA